MRLINSLNDYHEDARGICKYFAEDNLWAVCLLENVNTLETAIEEGWIFTEDEGYDDDPFYYVLEANETLDDDGNLVETDGEAYKTSLVSWLLAVNEPSELIVRKILSAKKGEELQKILDLGVAISGHYSPKNLPEKSNNHGTH